MVCHIETKNTWTTRGIRGWDNVFAFNVMGKQQFKTHSFQGTHVTTAACTYREEAKYYSKHDLWGRKHVLPTCYALFHDEGLHKSHERCQRITHMQCNWELSWKSAENYFSKDEWNHEGSWWLLWIYRTQYLRFWKKTLMHSNRLSCERQEPNPIGFSLIKYDCIVEYWVK